MRSSTRSVIGDTFLFTIFEMMQLLRLVSSPCEIAFSVRNETLRNFSHTFRVGGTQFRIFHSAKYFAVRKKFRFREGSA